MSDALVLAIDNGTSSTKCLVVDDRGQVVGRGQAPVSLMTPEPGWVEQDANEIWSSVRRAVADTLDPATAKRVLSVGLSTQRKSCVVWDRRSGEALTPVLSWQDQRTENGCASLRASGHGGVIRRKSGLPLDPMFSAAKARWLLDRLPSGQARAKAAETCIGTINSFILSRFGGEAVVEAGNASRTQLFDVVGGCWDEELLSIFDVPIAAMPRVVASTGPFPAARGLAPLPDGVSVGAVMADFPFRSLCARRLCAGASQSDAWDRLFSDGARRSQDCQRRQLRRARRLPDARLADRHADTGVRGQYPVRRIYPNLGSGAARRRHPGTRAPRGHSVELARGLCRARVRRPGRPVVGHVRGRYD